MFDYSTKKYIYLMLIMLGLSMTFLNIAKPFLQWEITMLDIRWIFLSLIILGIGNYLKWEWE